MKKFYDSHIQPNDYLTELIYTPLLIWRLLTKGSIDKIKSVIEHIESFLSPIVQESIQPANLLIKKFIINYYIDIAYYYKNIGQREKAFSYLKEALKQAKLLGNNFYLFTAFNNLLLFCIYNVDESEFLTYLEESEHFFENKQEKMIKDQIISKIAYEYMWNGRLKEALKYNDLVKEHIISIQSDEENAIYLKYLTSMCSGITHYFLGKIKESKRYYIETEQYAKIMFDKFDDPIPLSSVYGNIGETLLDSDKDDETFDYLHRGLMLRLQQPGAITHLSDTYYLLIKFFIKIGDIIDAEFHLKNFEEFITKWNKEGVTLSNVFNAYYSISKAIVLISKKSMKTNSEAQLILKKIVDESNVKTELIYGALLPLINLTIQEYKLFQSEEIFNNLKSQLNILNNLVKQTNSISLKIQFLFLQGKLNIILGNFDEVENYFNEAKEIAKEYQLTSFEKWINDELINFQGELKKWKMLITTNASLKDRIEMIELEEYVKGIQHILYEE